MRLIPIIQVNSGALTEARTGDLLSQGLRDSRYTSFKFAVAYMRLSGLNRIALDIDDLRARGGTVSGAVGLSGGVTSIEALQALASISDSSSVFHVVGGPTYHPKIYLLQGSSEAAIIFGSANLTCDGLYRNIEIGQEVLIDKSMPDDLAILKRYEDFVDSMLDASKSNVWLLDEDRIKEVIRLGLVKPESKTREPGETDSASRKKLSEAREMFPSLQVPVPPPAPKSIVPLIPRPTGRKPVTRRPPMPSLVVPVSTANTFLMQLSSFDSSHPTGVKGTPEILIPHGAVAFFPPIALTKRKYPDVVFNITLNKPGGNEVRSWRFWYYEFRATGTRIDEYRLRVDRDTVDMMTSGGADILVISRLPSGSATAYEVTIVSSGDPQHGILLSLCDQESQGKRWGLH